MIPFASTKPSIKRSPNQSTFSANNPHRQQDLEVPGDVHGVFDDRRLQQLLSNVVRNEIRIDRRTG
jgi:hypothetical protein